MIASLLRSTKGEISLLGKNIAKDGRFAKMNTGIVPQDLAIYEDMTAYENVRFFAGLYGLRGELLKKRTEEALEFVGLGDKHASFPKNFSGGMKRRLNIACAIAHRPKLIIMDEPTVGIDPHSRNYILGSVRKLNEMGCTIIYTSHYMEEVEEICTRIAIVDHGKIIAEGTKEQLTATITESKEIWIGIKSDAALQLDAIGKIQGVTSVRYEEQMLKIISKAEINNLNRIIQQLINGSGGNPIGRRASPESGDGVPDLDRPELAGLRREGRHEYLEYRAQRNQVQSSQYPHLSIHACPADCAHAHSRHRAIEHVHERREDWRYAAARSQ